MLLPNGDRAIVDAAKLRDYCLSPTHPRGKHKAHLFAAALGLTCDDWPILRSTLLKAACCEDETPTRIDEYGSLYEMRLKLTGPTRVAEVLVIWIVEAPEEIPRLVSCYPL